MDHSYWVSCADRPTLPSRPVCHCNSKGASVVFFYLGFLLPFLLLSFLLLQIFLYCHFQAKLTKHTHIQQTVKKKQLSGQKGHHSGLTLFLPLGFLFLHLFPAGLHEFKCIVTLILVSKKIQSK